MFSICVLATVSASVPSSGNNKMGPTTGNTRLTYKVRKKKTKLADSPEKSTSVAETVARTQIENKNALLIRSERKR